MRKTVSAIMLTLLLTSMLTLAFNIQPAKAASETIIDTHGDSRFTKYPSGPYWWSVADHDVFHTRAYNNNFWYTYCGAPGQGDLYFGTWSASISGEYDVFVWIPNPDPFGGYTPTHSANYQVYHQGGLTEKTVNQALRLGGWYSLGRFTFGASALIILNDRTGEPYLSTMVAFDAIKFVTTSPINQLFTLNNGYVSPSSGDTSTTFSYYVTYSDPEGDLPTLKYVYIDYSPHTMAKISGDYVSGAVFRYSTTLSVGSHNYYFHFEDSVHGHTKSLPPSGTYPGPNVPPQLEYRTLTVYSSPSGVSFTANGVSHSTPWQETYLKDTSVSLEMPSIYSAGDVRYYWHEWSDGEPSSSRTIFLDADTTVTGTYIGPYYELIVASSPISGIPFTIDGASKTTSYSEWLYQGYYTIEMPATYNEYTWQHWLEDGDTSRTRTVLLNTAVSLTAIYVIPSVPDFSITASPTYLTIQRGSSGSSTITITSINGFNQPVQLGVSGAPSGVTATLDPSQVTPPAGGTATSTLTISVDATAFAPPDTCAVLIVTGTSGTLTYSTSISLEIPPLQKVLEHPLVNPFPPNPSPYVRATVSYHPIDDATYEVLEVTFSSQGVNNGWIEFGIVDHDKYIASVSPVPTDKWYTFFHTSGEERVFPLSIIVHRNDIMAMGFVGVASGSVYFGVIPWVTLAKLYGDLLRNSWPVTTTFEPETSVFEVTSRAMPFELASLGSPGELRVYDSEGRTTGFVDGQPTEEILYSMIIDEAIVVFLPSDLYKYEVAGTADGSYDLAVGSVENGSSTFFIATHIPTLPGANHQYTINWDALSAGEEGVTVEVDSDGNDVPEYTFTSDSELTQNEFLIQTGQSALYVFSIVWGEETFIVSAESNSTVGDFAFNQPDKEISFNVTGEVGTVGFCNVTVPKALLYGEPWIVLIDGASVLPTITENATHSCLYFTYTHSTHEAQIIGTWVIAPPPPTYSLTITTTVGGTTDPGPGTYSYIASSTVEVTAIPEANYLLDYWELDSVNAGSANPYGVLMDKNHTLKAVFSPVTPPLSASISPLSASILVGQSVTFTSAVLGGSTPYSYQWYLNGNPVSGATSNTWTFTPTTSGIYYVYLKVTDDTGNTTQSETARITVTTVPVGGYSVPIQLPTTAQPATLHIALLTILTAIFITIKRKTKRKH